ncbi:NAD(+)/NADH kinase, partial [Pseudomonas aeruginosa]
GFRHRLLGEWQGAVSSAADTRLAIERLQEAGVALILFAGGDGTARDVAGVVREQQPVLGIPAGVKIHSGVYAISPRAAGELARRLVEGGLVRLASGE